MPQGQHHDAIYKVGRGGAGNFTRAPAPPPQNRDAPSSDDESAPAVSSHAEPPGPVRAGRGGAGNVVDPARLRDAGIDVGAAMAEELARRRHQQQHQVRAVGRGGAGNLAPSADPALPSDADPGEFEDEARRRSRLEELERRVEEVVDKGLRMPERAHHGREKVGTGHERA